MFSGKGVRDLRKYMHENATIAAAPANLANIRASYRMMSSAVSSMLAAPEGADGSDPTVSLPPFPEGSTLWAQMGAAVGVASSEPAMVLDIVTPLLTDEQEGLEEGGFGGGPTPLTLQDFQELDDMDQGSQDDMEGVIMSEQDPLPGPATTTLVVQPSSSSESSGLLVFRSGGGQSSAFRDAIVPLDDGNEFPSLQHPGHSHHCLQGHRGLELGSGSSLMEVDDSGQEIIGDDCSRVSSPGTLARSLNREGEGSGAGSTSPAEEEEEEDGDDDDDDDDDDF